MGMTAEVGSRPWQNPPQYNTVEEALDFYIPRMTEENFNDQLLDIMEMGIPLTTIANSIQSAGVMEGKHTIDVGMLIMPVLIEMMAYIGDDAGIEYDTGTEMRKDDDRISSSKIALAMKKMKERLPEELNSEETVEVEEVPEEVEPQPTGLMARRA
jgi:hypothetical protein